MKLLKNKKMLLIIILLVSLYAMPCDYLRFLRKSENALTFKLVSLALILYSSKMGINNCLMVSLCVIVVLYKIKLDCKIDVMEGMVGSHNLEVTKMPVPVNIIDLAERTHKDLYEKENEAVGSLFVKNIPKHIDFDEKEDVDRKLKLNGEIMSVKSRR
tara:strand:- start:2734 stop:3207 length:474 start_codon:yes stop_codon:yes gene_type:complete